MHCFHLKKKQKGGREGVSKGRPSLTPFFSLPPTRGFLKRPTKVLEGGTAEVEQRVFALHLLLVLLLFLLFFCFTCALNPTPQTPTPLPPSLPPTKTPQRPPSLLQRVVTAFGQGITARAPKPPLFHTTAKEPKRAHLRALAFKNTIKIQRKDQQERVKRMKTVAGEGKKRANFWVSSGGEVQWRVMGLAFGVQGKGFQEQTQKTEQKENEE